MNNERREIEVIMQQQALESLKSISFDEQEMNNGLSLYQSSWHQGIIGLLASRIKDKVYRPVIAFADADNNTDIPEQEKTIKGSARSVPGLHIRDILDSIATNNPQLLNKFGGHAMAAGMTINKVDLKAFSFAFNETVTKAMAGKDFNNIIYSDGELEHALITLDLAKQLQVAGPWGQSFPEPCFHGTFKVLSQRVLSGKHLKIQVENTEGRAFDGIAFFQEDELLNTKLDQVILAYKIDVNFFREQENLQLMIESIEAL